MASPFKMKGAPYAGESSPLKKHYKTAGEQKESPAKQARIGYWGKKTDPVVNEDGSVTTSRKNIFTGDTKKTTTSTKKGDSWEGDTSTKTIQKTKKDGSKARVKSTVTHNANDGATMGPLAGDKHKTVTKTKISNYEGTNDYKIVKQSVKEKGLYKGKKSNTKGSVSGDHEDGFQDPRIDQKTGKWIPEKDRNISSYDKADKKRAEGKYYNTSKKKWMKHKD